MKFALKVDEKHCWGCKACEVACKQEHRTAPSVKLIAVTEGAAEEGSREKGWSYAVNVCRHCDNAPCAAVCPVGAIARRADGIVTLDSGLCTGCGACADTCPHHAVAMDGLRNRAVKCNMCVDRVEKGLIPACADNVCLAHCIYFGDGREIDRMVEEKAWLKHRIDGTLGAMVIRIED